MLTRLSRPLGAILLLSTAVACSNSPTSASDATALDATLDAMAAESNGRGDSEAAAAFSGASLALRLGVTPTDIGVNIDGETIRYNAIVTGVAETTAGVTTVKRSLVAWKGNDRPVALLQVSTLGDQGTFGGSPRAHGIWADLVRRHRYVASDGTAGLAVVSLGENCTSASARALDVRCVFARYAVALDGLFRVAGSDRAAGGEAMRISINETGVAGVVLTRNRVSDRAPTTPDKR